MMNASAFFPVLWLVLLALVAGLAFAGNSLTAFRKLVSADPAPGAELRRQARMLEFSRKIIFGFAALILLGGAAVLYARYDAGRKQLAEARKQYWPHFDKQAIWTPPALFLAETDNEASMIRYGRDLISNTQDYFGENGLVQPRAVNALNCQSCHLEAGTKAFGNNYSAVQSTYPQMRARSGTLETIPTRVNDCFQRSLNGLPLDTTGREMRAILAYIRWLGTGVPKGEKPLGAGLQELPFLSRPADPNLGKSVYAAKCQSCHGSDGQGLPMPESPRSYPPLWGDRSYNQGAGLFRLSRLAAYVKANMPFGASYQNPQLSDEEAWDVAAFINAQPRPQHPFLKTDWPVVAKKPVDHPFGPFADTFPEIQHKFGPFAPIAAFYKNRK